jgi:hypothetical protein
MRNACLFFSGTTIDQKLQAPEAPGRPIARAERDAMGLRLEARNGLGANEDATSTAYQENQRNGFRYRDRPEC